MPNNAVSDLNKSKSKSKSKRKREAKYEEKLMNNFKNPGTNAFNKNRHRIDPEFPACFIHEHLAYSEGMVIATEDDLKIFLNKLNDGFGSSVYILKYESKLEEVFIHCKSKNCGFEIKFSYEKGWG